MYKQVLTKIMNSHNLTINEAETLADEILNGHLSDPQISAVLTALSIKGECSDEIAGFAKALKKNATVIRKDNMTIIDTCGTGGDGSNSFNISTTTAFVISGAGVKVAKHGNGSISSKCGSADVLKALGVCMYNSPDVIKQQLDEIGISFLFAPSVHPKMKNVMFTRKAMMIPTIFNLIGPLCNPMALDSQVIGVHSDYLVPIMAEAMVKLGIKNGAVVHGHGKIDELSLQGDNVINVIKDGQIESIAINGCQLGFSATSNETLESHTLDENVSILRGILKGDLTCGKRDIVLLNAALGLYVSNNADSLETGLAMAKESIDSGRAYEKLTQLIGFNIEPDKHRPTNLFM